MFGREVVMVSGAWLVRVLPQDWMINDGNGGGQIVLSGALKFDVFSLRRAVAPVVSYWELRSSDLG